MSGKNPIPNEQAYEGVRATNPPNVTITNHAPGSNQKRVHLGDIQINETSGIAYMLTDIVAGAQVWSVIGEGTTGDIITITGDSGGAQPGNAGNFNIFGTANQVLVSGSASTETISLVGPYTPSTYTDHAVLVGSGTNSITALAVGATGEVLIGDTGNDPAFGALGVNSGLTAHGVLLGEANSAIVATAAGTNGQVLVGSTGLDPVFATLTSDGSIDFTLGAGTLELSVSSSTMAQTTITLSATQIKGLDMTPVTVIPAPGAGKTIVPFLMQSKFVYGGTSAFTNPQPLTLFFKDNTTPEVLTISASGFVDATANVYQLSDLEPDNHTAANYEDQPMIVSNIGGSAITGNAANDNTIKITVFYAIQTL